MQPVTEAESQGDRPILNIVGEKIALGPVQKSITSLFMRWENDFTVTLMSGDQVRSYTQEALEEQAGFRKSNDEHRIEFAIYEQSTWRTIGTTHLRHIDQTKRHAEFGILIGERDCWGKGYGTEATILMLDYAFTVLGLHNVLLRTYAYNERAVRAYTRAGFHIAGRWREAARLGDQFYDIVFMDCLATEFHSPLKRVIELP
jgi:diamine N-acetyltransferase